MRFRVQGLSLAPFQSLFGLSEEELAQHGAKRYIVDQKPGFPDRIELRDAEPGESVLLVHYVHQPAITPYHASHAIFVGETARTPYDRIGEVPDVLRLRPISLRAFDADHMMIDADLANGDAVEGLIERLLANPATAYLHAHYARRGCYAARIERV